MADASEREYGTILRPRARLLRTLGEELISNEIVAVVELVKNAYDADATHVLIRFIGPLKPGDGAIEVIDNGHGMSLKTVQTVWMEPATSVKLEKRESENFHRRYLGEKGIGRFASSRLARELEVVSRRASATKEVFAIFDWSQFDDDRYLDEVVILWEDRPPADVRPGGKIDLLWKDEKKVPAESEREHGTILRMAGLKQDWGSKQFDALRRGLARLVSPRATKEENFEIELDLPPQFAAFSDKVEAPAVLKHPHYTATGNLNADGTYRLTCCAIADGIERSFKGRLARFKDAKGQPEIREANEGEEPIDVSRLQCGPVEIDLRAWDRDELGNVVQRTDSTLQDVRRDLDAIAGINIYRDGFRVLPYGEPGDDSFHLDRRRIQNPTLRLSNNQIYGVIVVSADDNAELRDQSNRQGLQVNQAYDDFYKVLHSFLSKLELLRWDAKHPKSAAKKALPVGGLFAPFDFKPLTEFIAKRLPQDKQAKDLLEQTEQSFGGQLKEIQTAMARYQRLATLGQLIDHVLHEGRQPIASINSEAALGLEETEIAEPPARPFADKIASRLTTIRKQGAVIATAFKRMEPFGGRRRGKPSQLYLEDLIRDSFAVFAAEIDRLGVTKTMPRTQTLVRVDPSEIQEVIINLLQNSLYWLEQVPESKRQIAVSVDRKGPDHVEVLFSDSGPGIPDDNREHIFEPYFSTKSDGVGLGLSISGEIVSDYYGGSLNLLDRGPLKGANFLVTLRKRV